MFCRRCGTENDNRALACAKCGYVLKDGVAVPAPTEKVSNYLVRNCPAGQGHGYQVFLGHFRSLPYRLGNLVSLPQSVTNISLTIANDHQGSETKSSTSLDYFSYPVYFNYLFR